MTNKSRKKSLRANVGIYDNPAKAAGRVSLRAAMLCMVLLLMWMCAAQPAGAAGHPYESKRWSVEGRFKIAGYYFWRGKYPDQDLYCSKTYSGKGKKLVEFLPGESWGSQNIISNGVYLYIAKQKDNTTQVCRVTIKTGKVQVIGSYTGGYKLVGYYRGKAYIRKANGFNEGDGYTLYELNLKNGSVRALFSDLGSECKQYGKYFICRGRHGDPTPTKLFVYNVKTGRRRTIAKRAGYFAVIDGLLYYSEFGEFNRYTKYTMVLKRATLKGKRKKALTGKIQVSMGIPIAFHKTYAIYYNYDDVYCKISYGSGKIKKVKKSKYDKLAALHQY